jgi:hypothetical protein
MKKFGNVFNRAELKKARKIVKFATKIKWNPESRWGETTPEELRRIAKNGLSNPKFCIEVARSTRKTVLRDDITAARMLEATGKTPDQIFADDMKKNVTDALVHVSDVAPDGYFCIE